MTTKLIKYLSYSLLMILAFLNSINSIAQVPNTISIDFKTKKIIGTVSDLNRDTYLQAHTWFLKTPDDTEYSFFKNEYNLNPDYVGSRRSWSPLSIVNNGIIKPVKKKYDGIRQVNNKSVATGSAGLYFYDNTVDYTTTDLTSYLSDLSTYIADNFKDEWDLLPEYYEPFNEPMIHASDYYPGANSLVKSDIIITKMCEFHREVGKAIHSRPELANLKMIGYASAFPSFENSNFGLWEKRYKKFIDIAGEDVDAFSVHLYDGIGVNNSGGRRTGSNVEAILDMIEAYSYERLNEVKPILVTEYGRLVMSQPGWVEGGTVSNYGSVENSQAIRSQIPMAMSFMERGSQISSAIPFSTGKQNPTAKFSRASMWNKTSDTTWELTPRKYFFEIWKDVKGKRIDIRSNNIDIQKQAFVDGNKVYVVLHNINDNTQSLNLNLVTTDGLQNVEIKKLKTFVDDVPELTITTQNTAPESIDLIYGETVVLTYTFQDILNFDNDLIAKKYYAESTLKTILEKNDVTFTINNVVKKNNGYATLRVGVGRAHGLSLSPVVTVNNQEVTISRDIIRGYDQNNRSQFFGVLEIPVDYTYLNNGTNTVKVKFTDKGGKISSVALQVESFEEEIVVETPKSELINFIDGPTVLAAANQYTFNVSYVANESRDVLVAIYNENTFMGSGKITVAEGSQNTSVLVHLTQNLPLGTTYNIRAIIREVGGDFRTNIDIKRLDNIEVVAVNDETLSSVITLKEYNSLAIYPNPVTNILNFRVSEDWKIFSIVGEKILEGNEIEVDVSSLVSGTYIVIQGNKAYKLIKF